jgi:hypothetical protein
MNITDVKTSLTRKLKGASIDDIQGISDYTLFAEAGKNVMAKIDPLETMRVYALNLYADVVRYTPPADLKGKKVIDIRPQTGRTSADNFDQTYAEEADRDKEDKKFSVEYNDGSKFLRINENTLSQSIEFDETTKDNWTAGTGVANIAEDEVTYAEEGRSLRFDITSGTSYLEWAGDSVVDLSDHQEKSSLFRWVYWPDVSLITSIAIRIGSSSSAYWTITGTPHFGSARTGWNLYRFDWNGATQTGTVDEENMDYERVSIVSTSDDTDIRIGKLSSKLPYPYEVVYYSNCMFRSTAGTWLNTPTADTDIVNLDDDTENIFLNECGFIASADTSDEEQKLKFDAILNGDGNELGLYKRHEENHPSEAMKPKTVWYKVYKFHHR